MKKHFWVGFLTALVSLEVMLFLPKFWLLGCVLTLIGCFSDWYLEQRAEDEVARLKKVQAKEPISISFSQPFKKGKGEK